MHAIIKSFLIVPMLHPHGVLRRNNWGLSRSSGNGRTPYEQQLHLLFINIACVFLHVSIHADKVNISVSSSKRLWHVRYGLFEGPCQSCYKYQILDRLQLLHSKQSDRISPLMWFFTLLLISPMLSYQNSGQAVDFSHLKSTEEGLWCMSVERSSTIIDRGCGYDDLARCVK